MSVCDKNETLRSCFPESTVALADSVIDRAPNLQAITYELMAQAVPILGADGIAAELVRLDGALGRGAA